MSAEFLLTGVAIFLIGGWIVAQWIAGDPIENWKNRQKDTPHSEDHGTDETPADD